mmetsp:Transcript_23081/g.55228  ORF Transcript_23081/g.55228 Transcript_23081/m.55228 type:complete len:320 (-) Transcript_23081:232-1191(-)
MRLSLLHSAPEAHTDSVWTATWTDAGQDSAYQLLTGSVDETVQLWQEKAGGDGAASLESLHTFTGHSLGVVSVATSQGLAASSALDSLIRVWDLTSLATKAVIECPPSETWGIAFSRSPSESPLIAAAGGSSGTVKLWSVADASEQATFQMPSKRTEKTKGQSDFTLSVAISPDGTRLAAGSMEGNVALFDLASGKLLHSLEGHCKAVRSLEFTPDSTQLLTASDDMHVHLYDVSSAALIEAFSGHSSWVLGVSCHPNGQCFASGSSDSTVKLWDMATRTCAQTVEQHSDQVWAVAFRPDGLRMVSASDDQSVAVYDFA